MLRRHFNRSKNTLVTEKSQGPNDGAQHFVVVSTVADLEDNNVVVLCPTLGIDVRCGLLPKSSAGVGPIVIT